MNRMNRRNLGFSNSPPRPKIARLPDYQYSFCNFHKAIDYQRKRYGN